MGKIIGFSLLMIGIAGYLYSWITSQKMRQKHIDELIVFLQKSIFSLGEEKVRIIDYFENYRSRDKVLEDTLQEIAYHLRQNLYPDGQQVWEQVFWEKQREWDLKEDSFEVVLAIGNGFFGRKRNENICFLQKSLKQLEIQRDKNKEKDAQERKVWIPVGMLGGIMLMIILI